MAGRREQRRRRTAAAAAAAAAALILLWTAAAPAGQEDPAPGPPGFDFEARFAVPAGVAWTDTGLEVDEGEEFHFRAAGSVSLQRGNPVAFCGPEGLAVRTVQQPVPDRNLGAFIVRVAQLVSISKDEETGAETRNEIVRFVYVGSEATVRMPLSGRLYLGLNEDVVGDNAGELAVEVWRRAG
ncbi:MAG: hypothetical protein JW742_04475 [Candidatus Aminicenantes bacterium]|nr:hypothetical protein [Candidatus Aminicenantes bacterium]